MTQAQTSPSIYILSGAFAKRRLVTPKGSLTRPTTTQMRQAVFNIVQHEVDDARFLDIAAGSGSVGLEALSRGAASCTFIEHDKNAVLSIYKNIEICAVQSQCSVICTDALLALERLEKEQKSFTLIYFDPPYSVKGANSPFTEAVLTAIDKSNILAPDGSLFLEESAYFDLSKVALQRLKLQSKRRFGSSYLYRLIF